MAKTIDQLLREADDIIEKRASQEPAASSDDSSVEKLASILLSEPVMAHEQAVSESSAIQTPFEKVAQSLVLVETLMNMDNLARLYAFEKAASERGFSEDQIEAYMEKAAAGMDYKRLLPLIPILGATAVAGAGGAYMGHRFGKKKGEKEGYSQALSDVDKAMKDYQL